jgi:hypothetical protein
MSLLPLAMFDQITLHRTEVLKLLQHVKEIRTAINRTFDRFYQSDFDNIEKQLLAMRAEINAIELYFELEHQIRVAPAAAASPVPRR